jgi:glycosyltransferase involved in cell wall biosynthesis
MKVLHVIKLAGIAGAETYLLNILPELQQKNIHCTLLALINPAFEKEAKKMTQILKDKGVKVIEILVMSQKSLGFYKEIASVVKAGKYDLVNTHLIHADIYLTIVKRLFVKNLVIASTRHGYSEQYQTLHGFEPVFKLKDPYRWVLRFLDKSINRVCTISYGLKNLLVQLKITPENKIDVIHYGFSYNSVKYDENVTKYKKAGKQILILGRLAPVKGHIHAFKVLPKLLKKYPDAALVLIGSGAYEEELKKMAHEIGIADKVFFEGFQMNVHDYIKNSDLVLIPSFAEGFCAVVLEAYQNLTPVMAFDVPALNEIIFNNDTGIIVKKFDIDELAEKIGYIFENPDIAKKLATNGYEKLHSYFTIERMVNQTIEFYNKTLTSK